MRRKESSRAWRTKKKNNNSVRREKRAPELAVNNLVAAPRPKETRPHAQYLDQARNKELYQSLGFEVVAGRNSLTLKMAEF